MLNISSTTAVAWPTPASTAVAPVSPTTAVQPVQAGGNDGKAQMGFGQERQAAARSQATATSGAVEGTPVPAADATTVTLSGNAPTTHDLATQRKERQQADKVAEQRADRDKKAVEHLQQMLANMWQASASVVERALGIESANTVPGNQSDTAPDLSAVAAATITRKPLPQLPERQVRAQPDIPNGAVLLESNADAADAVPTLEVLMPPSSTEADVVAYDEHGNSSLAPLEAGSIIDQRV